MKIITCQHRCETINIKKVIRLKINNIIRATDALCHAKQIKLKRARHATRLQIRDGRQELLDRKTQKEIVSWVDSQ